MTRDRVIEFINKTRIGYLATMDENNCPRVRPMGIYVIYDDDIYFFTFATTRKVAEINSCPQVEVVWANPEKLSQVRIKGEASMVEDETIQQRFRQDVPMVAKILPAGAEHIFRLYKIKPALVEMAEGLVPYTKVAW
jgi:uncharacterized pyridoxamine 5'-phosphate oxidase family protein